MRNRTLTLLPAKEFTRLHLRNGGSSDPEQSKTNYQRRSITIASIASSSETPV